MLPMQLLHEDGKTTITETGELVRVIQVQGRDYSGLPLDIQNAAFITRKQVFEQAGDTIGIATHSLRHRMQTAIKTGHHGNKLVDKMAEVWGSRLNDEIYRTSHYIVIYTRPGKLIDSIFTPKVNDTRTEAARWKALDNMTNAILIRLAPFNPWVLEGDNHLSFFAELVNGSPTHIKVNGNPWYADCICASTLYWPSNQANIQIYERGGKETLSAWFAIKQYPGKSTASMLEGLFKLPIALSLHQTFAPVRNEAAKKEVKDRIRLMYQEHAEGGFSFQDQADELTLSLTNNELQACMHSYALQVFGETESDLSKKCAEIEAAINPHGIKLVRESTNCEALFWSIFPGKEEKIPNCRSRIITSQNAAHACTFANTNEGLTSCSWGDEPISVFKTDSKADYAFTFHNSTNRMALGNTMIFGGSEAGKTTLFQFLDFMCLKYPGHKSLIFDSLRGMKIPAKMIGAEYEDFTGQSILNPLQLPDTRANRAFLTTFFQIASGMADPETLDRITHVIDQSYSMPFEDRRLADLSMAFGPDAPNTFGQAMKRWLPGGAYGHIFNADVDQLSFTNRRVYFDSTILQSIPEAFTLFAYYVFYAFRQHIMENPCPHTIFIDEMKRFLLNDVFAKEILSAFEQERKTDGVIVAAIQEVGALLDSSVGEHIIKSTATMMFFSDSTADPEEYIDGLGLTEREFAWVKASNPRKVLIKRARSGESTILNVDLAPLGSKLLGTINSSSKEVERMERAMREKGAAWRQAFWDSLQ